MRDSSVFRRKGHFGLGLQDKQFNVLLDLSHLNVGLIDFSRLQGLESVLKKPHTISTIRFLSVIDLLCNLIGQLLICI
jgi:hypothetical protein